MTNWELYNELLQQNTCCIDHEGDEYYDYPFIYYNNIKQNKWFVRIINHFQVKLASENDESIESHINRLNYLLFKDLYNGTIEAIQSLKEVEEWRNKLIANPANNETDGKICNITLNMIYSQCKQGDSK